MLSNAEFAQITGIPQDAMTPELTELAMFALPITCEDGKTVDRWQVRRKTMTEMGTDLRGEEAIWAKEEERRRQVNLAKYAELVDQSGEALEANDVSLSEYAVYERTR